MGKRIRTIGFYLLDKPLRSAPLSQTHPHLAQEWRHTGPDGPDKVTAGSGRAVNWKHERCGRKLIDVPISRRTRAFDEGCESEGCKYCSGSYLRQKNEPAPLPEWLIRECVDEPGLTPKRMLLDNSRELRLWQCPSGHRYRARISARIEKDGKKRMPQGCPCKRCYKGERIDLTKTSLLKLFKKTRKNEGYDSRDLPVDFKVFWGCDENTKHQSYLTYPEFADKGCQSCHRESIRVYLADERYKDLACEFVEAVRYPGWSPKNIRIGSAMVSTWRCRKNPEHLWRKAVFRRTLDKEGCPYCSGRRLAVSNSLASHKEIALEWDHEKNSTTPDCVKAKDRKEKYWFICSRGHSFSFTCYERVVRGLGCKICRVVEGNVAKTHPWTEDEWHRERNSELTPFNTTAGSKKIIWWQCRQAADHVYEKSLYDRCVRGLGCPFCLNRKASGSNSFGSCYPELAKYFDEEENGCSASEVRAFDQSPYWWVCDCGASYKRSPYHMVGMGAGCKHCRRQER